MLRNKLNLQNINLILVIIKKKKKKKTYGKEENFKNILLEISILKYTRLIKILKH